MLHYHDTSTSRRFNSQVPSTYTFKSKIQNRTIKHITFRAESYYGPLSFNKISGQLKSGKKCAVKQKFRNFCPVLQRTQNYCEVTEYFWVFLEHICETLEDPRMSSDVLSIQKIFFYLFCVILNKRKPFRLLKKNDNFNLNDSVSSVDCADCVLAPCCCQEEQVYYKLVVFIWIKRKFCQLTKINFIGYLGRCGLIEARVTSTFTVCITVKFASLEKLITK